MNVQIYTIFSASYIFYYISLNFNVLVKSKSNVWVDGVSK